MTDACFKTLTHVASNTVTILAKNPQDRGELSREVVFHLTAFRCHFHSLADFAFFEVRCATFLWTAASNTPKVLNVLNVCIVCD